MHYLKYILLLPALLFAYQMYRYTVSLQRVEKQRACRSLGILITAAGIVCLAIHDVIFVMFGFVLIMAGFRLVAFGLDRKNKTVFIDRFQDDHSDDTH